MITLCSVTLQLSLMSTSARDKFAILISIKRFYTAKVRKFTFGEEELSEIVDRAENFFLHKFIMRFNEQ